MATAIDGMFANSPYPTRTESERAATLGFISMLSAIITAVKVVSTVILLIILLVIGNTLAMSVRANRRLAEFNVWSPSGLYDVEARPPPVIAVRPVPLHAALRAGRRHVVRRFI